MTQEEIRRLVDKQRAWFRTGATLPVEARLEALGHLRAAMQKYRPRVQDALMADLKKCAQEGFMCETGLALSELSYVEKHLKKWAKDKRVPTPLTNFAARSFIRPMPYGVTLIMSPWNYPYLLSIEPAIDAIAAGNTVILKPSAYSPETSKVIAEMLAEALPEELCAVVTGGRQENQSLLSEKFDYIFFTGSQAVGREVLRRAAEHLTPVTLELGGKSPVVVDATANLPLTARRLVFGKYLNSGQTCVAPDYVLCEKAVKDGGIAEAFREKSEFTFKKAAPGEQTADGKGASTKHMVDFDNSDDTKVEATGWAGSTVKTVKLGYRIDDGETQFNDKYVKLIRLDENDPGDVAVINLAGQYAFRFSVNFPINELPAGDHRIKLVMVDEDGSETVVGTGGGSEELLFYYESEEEATTTDTEPATDTETETDADTGTGSTDQSAVVTTEPAATEETAKTETKGMPKGAVIAIIVAAVAVIGVSAFLLIKKKK